MKYLWLIALLFTTSAQAYTIRELREDCLAAEDFYAGKRSTDIYQAVKSGRCIAYLAGFADGFSISNYLADKVDVRLNAFCLPENDKNLPSRLVRAVLAQLDRLPPDADGSTAMLVAGALAKTFPCTDSLEPKK